MNQSKSSCSRIRGLATLCALAVAGLANTAVAADTLTGNWGGTRDSLEARGIALAFGYTSEDLAAVSGDGPDDFAHAGQLVLGADLDLDRLWGWSGTHAKVVLSHRDGDDLNERAGIQALLGPHELYGRGNVTRLTELSLSHESAGGKFAWKLGRITPAADFGYQECNFNNLSFCGSQAGNFVGDYWYNWPISQWGGVMRLSLGSDRYLKAGVYQVNPEYLDTRNRLSLAPSGTVGALSVLEYGWTPSFDGQAGSYKIGGWYSSAPRSDVRDADDTGTLVIRSGSYGGYLSALQQLLPARDASGAGELRAFVNVAAADQRTSTVDRTLAAGLVWKGPFPSRPADSAGIAFAVNHANERMTRRQALQVDNGLLAPMRVQDGNEYVLELNYAFQVIPGLRLQPGVQWIHNPGARDQRSDVVIVGMRSVIAF